MPNGNRKRPDTLELEVLGARQVESSDDEECGATARVLPKSHRKSYHLQPEQEKAAPTAQSFNTEKSEGISDGGARSSSSLQPQLTHIQTKASQKTHSHRWFHLRRRPRAAPADTAVLTHLPASEISAKNTGTTNTAPASLAKPEIPVIASSTTTITTTLPTSVTIPDVAAVHPRHDSSKRRSRIQTDSLYSLATIAQTSEIPQTTKQHSEPNVPRALASCTSDHLPWSSSANANITEEEAEATVYSNEDTITMQQTTRAFRELGGREHMLLTSELATSADDIIDDIMPPPTQGLKAWLMSVLGKLSGWKRNECVRRRSRSTHSAIGTPAAVDEAALGGNGGAESLGEHKSLNASSDFEAFSATKNGAGEGNGVFSNTKDKGIRRLSQMRRRRSSYYFSENERRIRANDREFNAQFKYADNFIKTSKYTLLTFLPFNLLEQFQRLANFYFLCLLVLQLIPAISSLTPVTTAIPLIGVLTLTAVKDAYDDIQRHLSDSQVNNRRSKTLRNGQLIDAKWSGVQVGDVIRLENNQFVAADILLLTTSEPNGLCFIETAELDGETNLKCKQCLPEITELGQRHDLLWNFNGEIICERPNNLLNKFEGTLIWRNQRYALDNEKILLRGCVLRNTQWCYGVVVFAGKDTKLMQNSGKTQFKSTGVDRLLNFIIIGIVLFLLSICAFFTLACAIWESFIGQHFQVYLPWENIIPKNVAQGSTVIGLLVFFSYAIVLNTVVPISLYVSVEVIRFAQSFLINWDEEMYYERSKTHAKARTTTLNEELGQIQYIFSDKTGTLTQNIMTFNKCSINGRTYGDVFDLRTGEVIEVTDKQKYVQNSNFNVSGSNSANKSTPAPTILLHTAEVHPKKSTIMVSSPENGGCADVTIAPTNFPTTKDATALPMTGTVTVQTALASPVQGSPPHNSLTYKNQAKCEDGSIGSSTPTESTAQRVTWRQRSASHSPTRRMRRQMSTRSNASDKVMTFGDSSPSTPHRALIVSFNNNNTSSTTTPFATAATSHIPPQSSDITTTLPFTIAIGTSPATSTPTPTTTPSLTSITPSPSALSSSSSSSLSQITTTMHSDTLSQTMVLLGTQQQQQPYATAASADTHKTKTKSKSKTKSSQIDTIGKPLSKKHCMSCCACQNQQFQSATHQKESAKSKLKSNLKSQSKKMLKQTCENCTKCTHQSHAKNVRINNGNKSKENRTATPTTSTNTDNAFNLYDTGWSSSHQKVHVCM